MPPHDTISLARHGKRRKSEDPDNNTVEKRGRLDDDSISTYTSQGAGLTRPKKRLSHADYTVAWICALPLELRAARLMLDEEHETLPVAPTDDNVYILGSIAGHNVAIANLRAGVYGLTSATAVGKDIMATFPNVASIPLLVGIGGGVPSADHDIRLGDVVVSTPTSEFPAVKQYDFGKTGPDGQLEIKGFNNKPAPVLLNAVASIQSRHDPIGRRIQDHISKANQRHDISIEHPGANLDILYEPGCDHVLDGTSCAVCEPPRAIEREPRAYPYDTVIHFGPIASGNQVIKHAQTRDRLAKANGFLCFEMEAAGLMDFLPCLVIRGIVDYCDSFKNKQFQQYAAFTAAAFAKELLSVLPRKKTEVEFVSEDSQAAKVEHRRLVMEALEFIEADNRRATIKQAHLKTCRWLFEQQAYMDWRDTEKATRDYGLLWIKGNPGTGKSTLMKFALEDIGKHKSKDDVVVSFFFNARGDSLEKSVEGLYRSLIVQLLTQLPSLQFLLDGSRLLADGESYKLEHLTRLFRSILQATHHRQLICLVDALDECPEEEARQMIDNFVDILSISIDSTNFRILFSSRHYPNISVDIGKQFVLEKEDGHAHDLTKYIQAELRIGTTKQAGKLKQEIFDKSNGIFLWVVLVVRILRREYDRGRVRDMAQRLNEIPIELNKLFKDILLRDNNNMNELVLCIQWILYSKRSLTREEFYHAMVIGNEAIDATQWDPEEATLEIMNNFILDSSKGLAEITRGKKPVVQFIHESVREFLQSPDALSKLGDGFEGITQANSHEQLWRCCNRHLFSASVNKLMDEQSIKHEVATGCFPLLEYAASSVLYHANEAQRTRKDQIDFLLAFNGIRWQELYNWTRKRQSYSLRRFPSGVLQFLAFEEMQQLIECWLQVYPPGKNSIRIFLAECVKSKRIEHGKALVRQHVQNLYSEAQNKDFSHFDVMFDLLIDFCTHPTIIRTEAFSAVLKLIYHWHHWHQGKTENIIRTALESAARMKRSTALRKILETQSGLAGLKPEYAQNLLSIVFGELAPVQIIKNRMREVSHIAPTPTDKTPVATMQASLDLNTIACIETLVNRGAWLEGIPNPADVMSWAEKDLVFFLTGYPDQWFVKSQDSRSGGTPLHRVMSRKARTDLLNILIHQGADVDAMDSDGNTPLSICSSLWQLDLEHAQALINHGANAALLRQIPHPSDTCVANMEKIKALKPETPCCELGKITTATKTQPSANRFFNSAWLSENGDVPED